jgi:hypothetical protein
MYIWTTFINHRK